MRTLILTLSFYFASFNIFSQNVEPWNPPTNFVTPEAYNFIKYGEIPVSEYTGIPDISIPIYTINLEDCSFPLSLTYHSGGIKVSEEASSIGLGWDLQIGSIVQLVNGTDDFTPPYNEMVLPDYIYSPMEYPFQNKIYDQINHDDHVLKPPYFSFVIFRDNLMLKDGFLSTRIDDYFYKGQKDCAPDIMKANFNGNSLEFIKDPATGSFEIINKKGYRISKIELPTSEFGFIITTPEGTEYYFEKLTLTSYGTESNDHILTGYEYVFPEGYHWDIDWSHCQWLPKKSRVWYLTKIKSIKNEIINFNYTEASGQKTDYSFESKWTVYTSYGADNPGTSNYDGPFYFGYSGRRMLLGENYEDDINITATSTTSSGLYLQEIKFPQGNILFFNSSRSDYSNSKKIDQILIYTPAKTINKVMLYHSYFQSPLSGNRFSCPKSDQELSLRLKLDSIKFNGEPSYKFTYNGTILPPKNSFAVDYWGYYNGSLQNTSYLPNVFRFEHITPSLGIKNLLLPNNNNNGSNLSYSKACLLERIQYPTGGETTFDFELNSFDNYLVADYDFEPITNNEINYFNNSLSTGQGLRIATITNWQNNEILSKTRYFYEGGKSVSRLGKYRKYNDCVYDSYDNSTLRKVAYENMVIYSGNFYQSSTFGSGSFVGYDKVTTIKYDGVNPMGKNIKYFSNSPDSYALYIDQYEITNYSQKPEIKNGLLQTEELYTNENLIQKKNNYYRSTQCGNSYYGAQFTQLGVYGFWSCFQNNCQLVNQRRHDLAYYFPIIQKETLLDSTITENNFNGEIIKTLTSYNYNIHNLISNVRISDSKGSLKLTKNMYPNEAQSSPIFNSSQQYIFHCLAVANRNTTICSSENWIDSQWIDEYRKYYKQENGLLLLESVRKLPYVSGENEDIVFDKYDIKGNPIETTLNGVLKKSYVWGYNDNYPLSETSNSTYLECGYTGFENDELNGWQKYDYNHFTNLEHFTGKKAMLVDTIFGPGKEVIVGLNANQHNGYEASVWVKGSKDAYIHIQANSFDYSKRTYNINGDDGKWHLLKVQLPRNIYNSILNANLKIRVFIGNMSKTPAYFDDLRFQPMDATMITYTYEPLIGITSMSDENNIPTIYDYDGFNRLEVIRDFENNILKKYEYNFKQH